MHSRSQYPHPAVLCLAVLSACTNGADTTGDPVPDVARAQGAAGTHAAPVATGQAESAAATAAAPAIPVTPAGVTSAAASPEHTAEFRELIAADWELAPGDERYVCVRQTFTEDVFVNSWRGQTPNGTHHVLVTTSAEPDGEPDGQSECDVSTLGTQNVFGAGVGTSDRRLPPGIAFKLPQGGQAILNLHLFNPTDKPMRGRSGALMQAIAEKDVVEVADYVIASTVRLDVPPGRSTSHAKCTIGRDATILGVAPHMHQMGVALKAVARTAIHGEVVLFDGPYSFDNQQGYPLDWLQFKAGDTVDVACTYENTTGQTLHWGGSSSDEMCQASLVRFPAGGPSMCIR